SVRVGRRTSRGIIARSVDIGLGDQHAGICRQYGLSRRDSDTREASLILIDTSLYPRAPLDPYVDVVERSRNQRDRNASNRQPGWIRDDLCRSRPAVREPKPSVGIADAFERRRVCRIASRVGPSERPHSARKENYCPLDRPAVRTDHVALDRGRTFGELKTQ